MAKCDDCDGTVVWLKKSDGRWFPPVEPILDFADGEHVVATADGYVQPIPQIYRRHKCLTYEERILRQAEREEEKRRLIEEDRRRRAEEARIAQELEEARIEAERKERQRREEEEHALALDRMRERYVQSFSPERLLPYPCRDCGAEANEPCRSSLYGRTTTTYWWNRSAHQARYTAEPLWGEDYEGPWPPKPISVGYRRMQKWVADNFTIFDPEGYRERDWLTATEMAELDSWLREHGDIFEKEEEGGTEGVVGEDGPGLGVQEVR